MFVTFKVGYVHVAAGATGLSHPGLSLIAGQRRASSWVLPRSLGNLEATWLPEQGETWFPVRVAVSLVCTQRTIQRCPEKVALPAVLAVGHSEDRRCALGSGLKLAGPVPRPSPQT